MCMYTPVLRCYCSALEKAWWRLKEVGNTLSRKLYYDLSKEAVVFVKSGLPSANLLD